MFKEIIDSYADRIGAGIWFGMWICRKLEMRTYRWESIK